MRSFVIILNLFSPIYSWAQAISVPIEDVKKEAEPKAEVSMPQTTVNPAPKKDVERIEVTGSHIRRIDSEGASPVTTITRKDLDKSGYNSIADVLRDNSANAFGSGRETTNSSTPGNAEINLRGLGADNTLVLLNGQRLPSDAVNGAVDISMIPMAAVERVEILKDGASAIYGSEALGGVVNIITRKDFTGTEVSLAQTTPELAGGKKTDINLVNGVNKGRFNMVNVVQYRSNDAVMSRDRSWSSKGVSQISTFPRYYTAAGGPAAAPNCPAGQTKVVDGGTVCTFKYSDHSSELPELKQFSLLTESNFEVNSKVKMTARLGGTQRDVKTQLAPAPDNITIPAARSHLGAGGSVLPGADPNADLDIAYRTGSLGDRVSRVQTYSYNALLGSTIQVNDKWQVDVTGATNRVMTDNRGVSGYSLKPVVVQAISDGLCNPFDSTRSCNLGSAAYQPLERMSSILTSGEVRATGELAHWSTGTLSLAVGTTLAYQSYQDAFDDQSVAGNVYGGAGSSGGGQRNSGAGYAELSIPLAKPLEMQVAGRYDHYSDFGDTVNPKVALLYHASKSVLVRTSAGTGFKAPLMTDLYSASSESYPAFIDVKHCNQEKAAGGPLDDCSPTQHKVLGGGNPGLKEERSQAISAGVVFEPNKDFNVSTDMYYIKNKNVVGINYEDLTRAEDQGIRVKDYGVIIDRDATGKIKSIKAPLQNLSGQQLQGFDIASSYRMSKFKLSTEHSQMLYFKQEGFPGMGYRNRLGENGLPPWRNSTGLTYSPTFRHDLNLVAMTTAGQQKSVMEKGNLRNYTELEFMYSYKSKSLGTFSAGIKNVLNTTPPIDDTNTTTPLDGTIYNQIGQQYFTGYKATF